MNEPHLMDGMVVMPHDEFEALLERAAERGARHALADVGLDGPDAARDIRELRSLLDAFNEAKKTAHEYLRRSASGIFLRLRFLTCRPACAYKRSTRLWLTISPAWRNFR